MAEVETNTETIETGTVTDTNTEVTPESEENAELAKSRAEMVKLKAALDKATKEAAESKRALRAKQTAEEAAAEAEKERQATIEQELAELRKERDVGIATKRLMSFVQDEKMATGIAEALYGAADIDLAVDTLNKVWQAREKALKLEYGRVPPPGVGATDGPTITKEQLDAMGLMERFDFANKHPDEYNKLMGR